MPIVNDVASDAFWDALKSYLNANLPGGWNPGADESTMRDAYRAAFGAFLDYIKANALVQVITPGAQAGTSALPGAGTVS